MNYIYFSSGELFCPFCSLIALVIVCMINSSMTTHFSVPLKKVKFGVNLLNTEHLFLLYRERERPRWTEKQVDIEMPVCVLVMFVGLQ